MLNIAIIGAGLSGLTAAHSLKKKAQVTVFEKSRGLGGRLSMRRAEPYFFDHGAQYFTAISTDFQNFLQPLIQEGIIQPWQARIAHIENRHIKYIENWGEQHPRYVGTPAMNSIGKFLAEGLNVHKSVRIERMDKGVQGWMLFDDERKRYGPFDWVLSAAPAPQMLALFPAEFTGRQDTENVQMQACFALMLGLETPLDLDFDGAQIKGEDIGWIALNHTKPGRESGYCLVVHSTNNWAQEKIDEDRDRVQSYLCGLASDILGHDLGSASHKSLHGWRYAYAPQRSGHPYLLDRKHCLAACGDWCVEGKVEGAFESGYQLAQKLLAEI